MNSLLALVSLKSDEKRLQVRSVRVWDGSLNILMLLPNPYRAISHSRILGLQFSSLLIAIQLSKCLIFIVLRGFQAHLQGTLNVVCDSLFMHRFRGLIGRSHEPDAHFSCASKRGL